MTDDVETLENEKLKKKQRLSEISNMVDQCRFSRGASQSDRYLKSYFTTIFGIFLKFYKKK